MPNWNHIVREHLAVLRLPPEREIEIVEELALHLEAAYEDALAAGLSEAEAEARAVQSYDWRLLECELSRAEQPVAARALQPSLELVGQRGGIRMESLLQDLRFGVRKLLKQPGFTLIAVITLALGIGANTAIFSVVQAVLLNPLPYKEADRLVVMSEAHSSAGEMGVSWPNYQDWQRRARSFEEVAASRPITLNLTGVEQPLRLSGRAMTWNFFRVLGVQPQLGRDFTSGDDKVGGAPTVILSDDFWKRRFGADPQVLGRTLNLSGTAYTVIGVMPPGFEFSPQEDVYAALGGWLKPYPGWYQRDVHPSIRALARLKPGVTIEAAQAEMKEIAAQLEREYPATNSGQTALVRELQSNLVRELRPTLLLLLGAVGFVLLIACVNVANLLLARAAARGQEMAVRLALGAGRGRLIRQLLTESLVLASLGGAAGLLWASGFSKACSIWRRVICRGSRRRN